MGYVAKVRRDDLFLWEVWIERASFFRERACERSECTIFVVDVSEQEKIAYAVVVVDIEACEEFFSVESGEFGGFVLVGKEEAFGEPV